MQDIQFLLIDLYRLFCGCPAWVEDSQTRGANQFLTVLEQMQMLTKMHHTRLQDAVVSAMFAATIESDMPPDVVANIMGEMHSDKEAA